MCEIAFILGPDMLGNLYESVEKSMQENEDKETENRKEI